jgi:hypothetical protein|tara:strand:+ start:96 stop:425 length:330 start_codon:yes stop_codon:yes gene_type:complete
MSEDNTNKDIIELIHEIQANKASEVKEQFDMESESLSLSWKDEIIVIVLLFPIPITFISTFFTTETMSDAWKNLGLMPDWYQTLLLVVTLVVFGLKALVFRIAEKLFKV